MPNSYNHAFPQDTNADDLRLLSALLDIPTHNLTDSSRLNSKQRRTLRRAIGDRINPTTRNIQRIH